MPHTRNIMTTTPVAAETPPGVPVPHPSEFHRISQHLETLSRYGDGFPGTDVTIGLLCGDCREQGDPFWADVNFDTPTGGFSDVDDEEEVKAVFAAITDTDLLNLWTSFAGHTTDKATGAVTFTVTAARLRQWMWLMPHPLGELQGELPGMEGLIVPWQPGPPAKITRGRCLDCDEWTQL